MHVCMRIRMYACNVCIVACMYACVFVTCMYVSIYVCLEECICVGMHVCVYLSVLKCIPNACIHIQTIHTCT